MLYIRIQRYMSVCSRVVDVLCRLIFIVEALMRLVIENNHTNCVPYACILNWLRELKPVMFACFIAHFYNFKIT